MFDVQDLRPTIIPKSDQLNAEQLLGGAMTVTVTDVRVSDSAEQPVSIHYAGEDGRPYKPCKTMRKMLIFAWGQDGRAWVGRSMTLYNDPSIRFGGATVGGVRISHLSDIERDIAISLTATKGKKAQHTVKRLQVAAPVKPARTAAHDEIVAMLEREACDAGFEAFKTAWGALPKSDRAAIGTAERDRIGAIGQEFDALQVKA